MIASMYIVLTVTALAIYFAIRMSLVTYKTLDNLEDAVFDLEELLLTDDMIMFKTSEDYFRV